MKTIRMGDSETFWKSVLFDVVMSRNGQLGEDDHVEISESWRSPPAAVQTTLFYIVIDPSVMIARFPGTFSAVLFENVKAQETGIRTT